MTKQIGEGGTSWVYQVLDDAGIQYAVKLLKVENGTKSEVTKRFKNEIFFCKRDVHPRIVRVLDSGLFLRDNRLLPFYVMPLYDSSFRSVLKKGVKPEEGLEYIVQMFDAVEAAHLAGATHRDIKPENFLLDERNKSLVIADFGIACFHQEELYTLVETPRDARLANYLYASPEQKIRGATVDQRSDIFSLGLIVNEVFTGLVPAGTGFASIGSKLPSYEYLDPIVERMIAQDPGKRYQSIGEIKKDLMGRKIQFVQLQTLNQEKRRVVSVGEIDHPLVQKPIELESVDWQNNELFLVLNQAPDSKWLHVFRGLRNAEFFPGKEPARFEFKGKVAKINCDSHLAPKQVELFKKWLTLVQQQFLQTLREEKAYEINNLRQAQEERIAMEERRKMVLQSIQR